MKDFLFFTQKLKCLQMIMNVSARLKTLSNIPSSIKKLYRGVLLCTYKVLKVHFKFVD